MTLKAGEPSRPFRRVIRWRLSVRDSSPSQAFGSRRLRIALLPALVGITALLAAAPAVAQSVDSLQVCRNFNGTQILNCTGNGTGNTGWNTSTANRQNGLYREGDFVPVRAIISGLIATHRYTLRIEYDAVFSGLHAYDYLGTYNASRAPGQRIDPCSDEGGTDGDHACGKAPSRLTVPTDENTTFAAPVGSHPPASDACAGRACVFSAWGVKLDAASYVNADYPSGNQCPACVPIQIGPNGIQRGSTTTPYSSSVDVIRYIDLTFTAQGHRAVIAWGGHIAAVDNWGEGNTLALGENFSKAHIALPNFSPGTCDRPTCLSQGNRSVDVQTVPRPSLTTDVNVNRVVLGGSVIDTATLGGPPVPTGLVRFFICSNQVSIPICTTNQESAGHLEVLARKVKEGISAIKFTPTATGSYCFRVEYVPAKAAPFSAATHTNQALGGECFEVTPPPTTLTVKKKCVGSKTGKFNVTINGASHEVGCRGRITVDVEPGVQNTVSEKTTPGFTTTIGGRCSSTGLVTVPQGQSRTCVITNTVTGTPTAKLTVVKECPPSTPGVFDVLVDGDPVASDLPCGEPTGPVDVAIGPHKVTEKGGTGTSLGHYTVAFNGNCASDGSVTVPAGGAECTITNTLKPSTLEVIKECRPKDDTGHFDITIEGPTTSTTPAVPCGGSTHPIDVAPGGYKIGEHGALGTDLAAYTQLKGGDCDPGGFVEITPGKDAVCTIENIRHAEVPKVAEVTLLKLCAPTNDGGLFNLRIDHVTERDQYCGGKIGPLAVLPGTYHALVGETAGTGTDLSDYTSVIGGACRKDGSIHLTAGQSATCTITNIRNGTPTAVLTVLKRCRPAHDRGRFVVDIDEDSFRGMRCGESTGPVTVATGTRLVGEVAAPPDIGTRYITEYGGDCAANGTITLRAHHHATCTVTNIRIQHAPLRPRPPHRPRPPKPPPPVVTG